MGRLIEEPRQQKWIPDMHHFCRANGYQTFDEAKRMSGFWYEYVIHDLRTCFPSAFMNSRAAHVEEGIQILIASLMQYPANSILIEEFQILMSSCSFERDEGIGLCIGPLPVYFCGHYSFGPCVN